MQIEAATIHQYICQQLINNVNNDCMKYEYIAYFIEIQLKPRLFLQ